VADNIVTATGGPAVRRWRRAAWIVPVVVLATGGFAVDYPSFSPAILVLLVVCFVGLLVWAMWLSLGTGHLRPRRRLEFSIVTFELFAIFGCVTVWRSWGGGPTAGLTVLVLYCACVGTAVILRRPLYRLVSYQNGPLTFLLAGGTIAVFATMARILIRMAPVWFAQHLLLPVMLLFAVVFPPYWAGVEELERRPR
jgi:hypothetical protein